MLRHLLVLHLHVEALLVPVDQLLQRRRQFAIGGDHGDELADVERAADREIAADRVEEERRQLRQEVVEELDDEFPVVDLQRMSKSRDEPLADLGALLVVGVVDCTTSMPSRTSAMRPASSRDAICRCLPSRSSSRRRRGMIAICSRRRASAMRPEPDVLHHDEDDRRQRLAAEEHRLDEGVADEAADRLDLVLDHGRELGRLTLRKWRRRKAQDAVVELVAQAAQHALAQRALWVLILFLNGPLMTTATRNRAREAEEQAELVDLEAVEECGSDRRREWRPVGSSDARNGRWSAVLEGVALDAVVDDRLRHVERQEIERLRGQHDSSR